MSQNTSHAVMAQRHEPHDSLDYFPTPPWATRALCEWLGPTDTAGESCWEPACGEGHMARPLAEYFDHVWPTDVHDYGHGTVLDFLFPHNGILPHTGKRADWIITNPPFRLAADFISAALARGRQGVAVLCRSVFMESGERFRTIFRDNAPTDVLVFCERVPMLKGRLDPKASSATSYAWFVWRKGALHGTRLHWIPPGTRKRLERSEDYVQ